MILHTDIKGALANGASTGAVFLDIKGAFDNVVPSKLMSILETIELPTKLTSFIGAMIVSRSVEGFVGGRSMGVRIADRVFLRGQH